MDAKYVIETKNYQRIRIHLIEDVIVVRFVDRRIIDDAKIKDLGAELFSLAEKFPSSRFLISFSEVEFLSSTALGKLLTTDRLIRAASSILKLTNIRPEIMEVFDITKLSELFNIEDSEASALASFK